MVVRVQVVAHLTKRHNDGMSALQIDGMEGLMYYMGTCGLPEDAGTESAARPLQNWETDFVCQRTVVRLWIEAIQ